jgi:hypothetical protein
MTLKQARDAGLLGTVKDARMTARISSTLLNAAKARAGISSNTAILELALATVALEDVLPPGWQP